MSMFDCELAILERGENAAWFLEIKKKAFLEGAASVIYDISQIPERIKDKDKKITVSSVTDWAEKKLDEINRELNQMGAFELQFMLIDRFPKKETEKE
jgi:hypothetical protein